MTAHPRARVLRAVAELVGFGGLLLIVDHASVPPWSWVDPETRFPTPEQFLGSLHLPAGQWHPERLDALPGRRAVPKAKALSSPTPRSSHGGSRSERSALRRRQPGSRPAPARAPGPAPA